MLSMKKLQQHTASWRHNMRHTFTTCACPLALRKTKTRCNTNTVICKKLNALTERQSIAQACLTSYWWEIHVRELCGPAAASEDDRWKPATQANQVIEGLVIMSSCKRLLCYKNALIHNSLGARCSELKTSQSYSDHVRQQLTEQPLKNELNYESITQARHTPLTSRLCRPGRSILSLWGWSVRRRGRAGLRRTASAESATAAHRTWRQIEDGQDVRTHIVVNTTAAHRTCRQIEDSQDVKHTLSSMVAHRHAVKQISQDIKHINFIKGCCFKQQVKHRDCE